MFLRQSTASQVIELGPFTDDTDFKTAKTALTIANTDIKIRKEGGTTHGSKNSGGGTHIANGYYYATLDATDTNTVGQLDVHVNVASALPVWKRFQVLEEAVYDALFASSAPGYVTDQPVNVTKFGGTTVTARDIGASVLLSPGTGTGQLDFTSGVVKSNVTQFNGSNATSASGRPEVNVTHLLGTAWATPATAGLPDVNVKQISTDATAADNAESFFDGTGYAGTNNVIPTVTDVTTKTGYRLSATGVDDVWDEATSGHTTAGTTGKALIDAGSAGDPWATALPGAYGAGTAGKIVGDNLNATVGSRLASASYTTPPTAIENADALLKRDMSAVTGEASRSPLNAFRFLRNLWAIVGGTLTVKKEDDSTTAWTATVTTTAGDPVSSVDPT